MFVNAWPDAESTVGSQLWAAGIAASVCFVLSLLKRASSDATQPRHGSGFAFVAGALLFAAMNAGQLAGAAGPKSTDLMIALALAPVVVALVQGTRDGAGTGISGAAVAPGILAAAGLLLIVPQPSLSSWLADAVLLATPLGAGISAVWLGGSSDETLTPARAAWAFAGAASVFAGFLFKGPRAHVFAGAVAFDLLTLLLAMRSLAVLGARRFSAQFAAVPLLLLVEGLVFERVRPNWEQTGGLLAIAVAAGMLLRLQAPEESAERVGLFA